MSRQNLNLTQESSSSSLGILCGHSEVSDSGIPDLCYEMCVSGPGFEVGKKQIGEVA